jgi:hypothetical protein
MNTLCLVIDRLHAGYLGAYGNTWIQTPSFDRVAAEGFTFDGAFIESPRLEHFYDACWLGRHAMGLPDTSGAGRGLLSLLTASGVDTRLLTDDPLVSGHRLAGAFDELVRVNLPSPCRPADSVEDTLLGQCFAQILEMLDSVRQPFLLWCHLGSLGTAWDAPRDFRLANCDEGDPEPPDIVLAPNTVLLKNYDPDELLGFSQLYAAQVCVLDTCLGVVRDWLTTSPVGRETLLAITSARGFPLGEHLRVGGCDEALYSELVQVPMMFRFPDQSRAADRSSDLVQPSDLAQTLCEWHGVAAEGFPGSTSLLGVMGGEADRVRQCVGILGPGTEQALVTPAWLLRQAARPELFSRPDDRWCANDVADRCPDIVEAMSLALSQYRQTVQSGYSDAFPALSSDLLTCPE